MSIPPTFTELMDWIDGRLDDARGEDVARRVDVSGPETAETVAWIRSFRAAADTMPLAAPPPEVGHHARAAFRHLRAAGRPDASWFDVAFDSRLAPVAGVRSSSRGGPYRLDLTGEGIAVSIDVTPLDGGSLAIDGTVRATDATDAAAEDTIGVVFTSAGETRRRTAVDRHGRFSAEVPGDVDEIRVVDALRQVRAGLSPRGPS